MLIVIHSGGGLTFSPISFLYFLCQETLTNVGGLEETGEGEGEEEGEGEGG